MTAPFTKDKAVRMVSDLKTAYGDRITKNQFIAFLVSRGLGSSYKSVKGYLELLENLGLIELDPYGAGLITLNREISPQPRDRGLTSFM